MVAPKVILGSEGEVHVLMGNEAIARGALEAGVQVATGYPGTPSSEVLMTLIPLSLKMDFYAEWSVNERVAFEIAFGASLAGVRALTTMKAPGLNVASDPVVSAMYSGVNGGLVILVADDPGPHTTQTEQDSRWYAQLAKIPTLEPSTPQEAKDYTVYAFNYSEKYALPFMIRTTTRVNHTVATVQFGPLRRKKVSISYHREPERFVRASMEWNRKRHEWLNSAIELIERELGEDRLLNTVTGEGDKLIVTSGACYLHVLQLLENRVKNWKDEYTLVKIGLIYPFPESFMEKLLEKGYKEIIVVEESDPYIEFHLRALSSPLNLMVKGRGSGFLPKVGEVTPETLARNLLGFEEDRYPKIDIPARPPPLCPGCPHRASYLALLHALRQEGFRKKDVPIIGDIGCYALSVQPPLEAIWNEHSMGASISIAMGLKIAGIRTPVIATIGDSTLYHSGILSLIEAVHKDADIMVVVLDNNTVAMTGHQETPACETTSSGRTVKSIPIESLLKAIGVEKLWVTDPYDYETTVSIFRKALKTRGLRVVLCSRPCALITRPWKKTALVDQEKCRRCLACLRVTGCPAFVLKDDKLSIDVNICNGCGLCTRFCPYDAIKVVER
ncbi:MAG: indolepyruvate ferredoxin oxidoreductase subunit alpha [Thermoproteales archaeon]|nr:indolepyruvate ferredoxin oxidoreductase subunit alpha [Thermoproteales archaeon]